MHRNSHSFNKLVWLAYKAVARKFPREGPNQENGIRERSERKFFPFFFVNVIKIEQNQ